MRLCSAACPRLTAFGGRKPPEGKLPVGPRRYAHKLPKAVLPFVCGHRPRGLTHIAGECTSVMAEYLGCIKRVKGVNVDECRALAKSYLGCRMDW